MLRDDDGWQTGIVALSGDENGRLDNSDAPTEIKEPALHGFAHKAFLIDQ